MRYSAVVELPKEDEPQTSHNVYVTFHADDGFLYRAKKHVFDGEFRARSFPKCLEGWEEWEECDKDDLTKLRRIVEGTSETDRERLHV